MSRRTAQDRFETPEGAQVLLEESHQLPLVDVELVLRTGTLHDPPGREGLTRLTWLLARAGTRRMRRTQVEDAIAELGASLSVEAGTSYVRFHGMVIRRNLEPFMALLASLVRQPAFRAKDLAHLKRETLSDLVALRDNDRALGGRFYRQFLFGPHPYGRPVSGTPRSIKAIRRDDVVQHHQAHLTAGNLLLGVAGDVTRSDLETMLGAHFTGLPRHRPPADRVGAPKVPRGRRVLIVDKPERTQTQLYIGTLGSRAKDTDLDALTVANQAFGGTFTARLMNEVRSKRGWSYGAYSRLGQDRQRDAWSMWTFPAAKDAAACAALELDLLEDLAHRGLTAAEIRFAKKNLVNGHCFEVDTAAKRLEARMDDAIYGLPADHWKRFTQRVRAVKRADANAAVERRLSPRDLAIVVVATAEDVRPAFEDLPGVTSLDVVPYTQDGL